MLSINKKAFTLIEVLTVIVIITAVMMVTVPLINSILVENRTEMYHSYEKMMEEYAIASNIKDRDIQLSELDGLDQIKQECNGYVKITVGPQRNYKAFITCGDKYSTEGSSDIITVMAGAGISNLSLSGWTGSGTAELTKEVASGTSINLNDFVRTFKDGYSCTDNCEFTKTSGNGTINGTIFKTNGPANIVIDATNLAPPVFNIAISSEKQVYGYTTTRLSYSGTTVYDSDVTITPSYTYDTQQNGSFISSQSSTISATSHKGTRYYRGLVTVTGDTKADGSKISTSGSSNNIVSLTMVRTKIIPNANDCGSLSSSNAVYAYKGENKIYTDEINGSVTSWPTLSTISGYNQTGWFSTQTCSPKVLNNDGSLSGNVIDKIVTANAWNATTEKIIYAQCDNSTGSLSSTMSKLSNPTCTDNVGLCDDFLVSGRKVYRGASVNNYIRFAGKTWRIMAIEPDGKLMIMEYPGTGYYFDVPGTRTGRSGSASYCAILNMSYGCEAWSNISPIDGKNLDVNQKSGLNTNLNGSYYNNFYKIYSNYIQTCPSIGIGTSSSYGTLQNWYNDERKVLSNETVSIMSVADLFRASSGATSGSVCSGQASACLKNNWIVNGCGSSDYWVVNPGLTSNRGYKLVLDPSGQSLMLKILEGTVSARYFPVIYLNGNVNITGESGASLGSLSNPYVVEGLS